MYYFLIEVHEENIAHASYSRVTEELSKHRTVSCMSLPCIIILLVSFSLSMAFIMVLRYSGSERRFMLQKVKIQIFKVENN